MELVDCLGNPRPEKKVLISDFKGADGEPSEVRVRVLSFRHQIEVEELFKAGQTVDGINAAVFYGCVKADGASMFSDKDKAAIDRFPHHVTSRIFNAIKDLQERSADMEAVKKKSRTARRSKSR